MTAQKTYKIDDYVSLTSSQIAESLRAEAESIPVVGSVDIFGETVTDEDVRAAVFKLAAGARRYHELMK